jgi:hypothetical protein
MADTGVNGSVRSRLAIGSDDMNRIGAGFVAVTRADLFRRVGEQAREMSPG